MNIFYTRISFCISPCVTETCLLTGPHLRPVGEQSKMHRWASGGHPAINAGAGVRLSLRLTAAGVQGCLCLR